METHKREISKIIYSESRSWSPVGKPLKPNQIEEHTTFFGIFFSNIKASTAIPLYADMVAFTTSDYKLKSEFYVLNKSRRQKWEGRTSNRWGSQHIATSSGQILFFTQLIELYSHRPFFPNERLHVGTSVLDRMSEVTLSTTEGTSKCQWYSCPILLFIAVCITEPSIIWVAFWFVPFSHHNHKTTMNRRLNNA